LKINNKSKKDNFLQLLEAGLLLREIIDSAMNRISTKFQESSNRDSDIFLQNSQKNSLAKSKRKESKKVNKPESRVASEDSLMKKILDLIKTDVTGMLMKKFKEMTGKDPQKILNALKYNYDARVEGWKKFRQMDAQKESKTSTEERITEKPVKNLKTITEKSKKTTKQTTKSPEPDLENPDNYAAE